jgi:hypothetical protein
VDREGTEGRLVYDLGNNQWDIAALRRLLEEVLPNDDRFEDYRVEHDFEDIGRRVMVLNARRQTKAPSQTQEQATAILRTLWAPD